MQFRISIAFFASVVFVLAMGGGPASAQGVQSDHGHGLQAADFDARTSILPVAASKYASPSAVFDVTFEGFSAEAEAAVEYALSLWATHISSSVPIRVRARWQSLAANTLGSAGPGSIVTFSGSPEPYTLYAPALAAAISGQEVDIVDYDIIATFNSDRTDWYFGLDGQTPIGTFDFVTVVLHEIGHGIGMFTTFRMEGEEASGEGACTDASENEACWGHVLGSPPRRHSTVLDRFVYNGVGDLLINTNTYPIPSSTLADILTGGSVFFDGPTVREAHGNEPARSYAPSTYQPASSLSHLDEATYPPGDPNSLMTPSLARAEAIHSPGPIFCGLLSDIGWPLGDGCVFLIENPDLGTGDDNGTGDDGNGDDGGNGGDGDDDTGDGHDGGNGDGNDGDEGGEGDETSVGTAVPGHGGRALTADGPYPNPTSAAASVVLSSGTTGPVTVTVIDMMGRERSRIDAHLVADNQTTVDIPVSTLDAGVYMIRIAGTSAILTRTLVIVR